jgi:hypothetical protein
MSFDDLAKTVFDSVNRTFGTDCVYTHISDNSTSEISGVFVNEFVEINGITDQLPVLKNVKLELLQHTPEDGDTVAINSLTYTVKLHQPDGLGSTNLILSR